MASHGIGLARPSHCLNHALRTHPLRPHVLAPCSPPRNPRLASAHRTFTVSARRQNQGKESFRARLSEALKNTKIEWKPIPIALGVGFLGAFQFYRIQRDERARRDEEASSYGGSDGGDGDRPPKRKRIRPSGPWYAWSLAPQCCRADSKQASPGYVDFAPQGSLTTVGSF
ncbi:hypothetical protein MPH_10369 [Macrophomina phaseolina MS6]|uniref:Uncharacterized protein n=1 Tax=Macrophomina phaseolina (strain MS6) TaxID=1126212 RepID=K2RQN7_MACPH|nr:hypothetical protein MPH_10369 [Macrophomina phaseolina MS6]